MKYVVCLKQVPDTKEVLQDEKTGSLIRDSAGSIPNPYDHSALEACLQARELTGGTIKAITMGPKQARASLRNAFSLGVDEAYHMMDNSFSGGDVFATAYTLSLGIKKIGYPDVIFCGKQSTDGDTGQIAAELAEILDYAHVYYVSKIVDISNKEAVVVSKMGSYIERIKLRLPAVLSIDNESFTPRISSFRGKILAQKKPINILTLDDLEVKDREKFGYLGSPTRVKRMIVPETNRDGKIISGDTSENVDYLLGKLSEWEELL